MHVHARSKGIPGRTFDPVKRSAPIIAALAAATVLATSGHAGGKMKSARQPDGTCATQGGARIVGIPGFPGERVDRRLLADIRWLQRRYKIFVTDGYSNDPVHAANGEHPLGLALDIVPDRSRGGTWADVTALARWAEPRRDRPRAPFRWVGYNGDAGHGRGHHLHLSWNHSTARAGKKPRTVYTLRCPSPQTTAPEPEPEPEPPAGGTEAGQVPNGGVGAKPRG